MNETQGNLELGIGDKEAVTLKPARVKIEAIEIQKVGDKGNEKVVCAVKHPDKEEQIHISSVKYIKADKVTESGLWINFDEDKKIRKGSALALFMNKLNVDKIGSIKGKEIDTEIDSKGYLTFKLY